MKSKTKCITPHCGKKRLSRGLCPKHYWQAAKAVRKHQTTWGDLEVSREALAPIHGRAGMLRRTLVGPAVKANVQTVTDAVHASNGKQGAKTCLVPGCTSEVSSRGLCTCDYTVAADLIKKGKTSWKQLVGAGKALPIYSELSRSDKAKMFFLS